MATATATLRALGYSARDLRLLASVVSADQLAAVACCADYLPDDGCPFHGTAPHAATTIGAAMAGA